MHGICKEQFVTLFFLCNTMCSLKFSCQHRVDETVVLPIQIHSVEDTLRVDELFKLPFNSPDLENGSTLVDVRTNNYFHKAKDWFMSICYGLIALFRSTCRVNFFSCQTDAFKLKPFNNDSGKRLSPNLDPSMLEENSSFMNFSLD